MVACDYNCVAHGERGVMTVRLRRRHAVVIIRVCFCYRLTTFGPNIKHLFPSHTFFKTRAAPNFCSLVSKKIQRVLAGRAHTGPSLALGFYSFLSCTLFGGRFFFFLRARSPPPLSRVTSAKGLRAALWKLPVFMYIERIPLLLYCASTQTMAGCAGWRDSAHLVLDLWHLISVYDLLLLSPSPLLLFI